ncbi:MAG TPA: AIR synthase related protein [Actinomycetota bacterium]
MRRRFGEHPGLAAKAELAIVAEVLGASDWIGGPGDDAAVVLDGPGAWDRGGRVVVAGEAILPALVAADPFGAGIAAIVANVNDIAATGGTTLAIVDTVVGSAHVARRVLEGMAFAAGLYGVPIVGGHLTVADAAPSVSAFAVGRAAAVLSSTAVREGQALLVAACLEGELREDFPFFSSIRRRGSALAGDVAVLPELAGTGAVVASKDVSMAGLLGSLAMLLEPTGCGARVDLAAVPRPEGIGVADWTAAYLSYGFLLCAEPDRAAECEEGFHARDLACARVGTIDRSGRLTVRLGDDEALLLDVAGRGVTHLGTAPAHRHR